MVNLTEEETVLLDKRNYDLNIWDEGGYESEYTTPPKWAIAPSRLVDNGQGVTTGDWIGYSISVSDEEAEQLQLSEESDPDWWEDINEFFYVRNVPERIKNWLLALPENVVDNQLES